MRVRHSTLIKCTRLLEAFEGHRSLAGNFDGQVLSWGFMQWNLGQGTLRPLLLRLLALDRAAVQRELGAAFVAALERGDEALKAFAFAEMLAANGGAKTSWQQAFARLNDTPAASQAQAEAAKPYYDQALSIVTRLGFASERGYALALDIAVQNWSVTNRSRPQVYQAHQERLAAGRPLAALAEWERLKALAHAMADTCDPQWRRDVLARKLTIALGEGWVHGRQYHLADDYGIHYYAPGTRELEPWAEVN